MWKISKKHLFNFCFIENFKISIKFSKLFDEQNYQILFLFKTADRYQISSDKQSFKSNQA